MTETLESRYPPPAEPALPLDGIVSLADFEGPAREEAGVARSLDDASDITDGPPRVCPGTERPRVPVFQDAGSCNPAIGKNG